MKLKTLLRSRRIRLGVGDDDAVPFELDQEWDTVNVSRFNEQFIEILEVKSSGEGVETDGPLVIS